MPKNILELYEALHMIFLQLLSFQWRGNHNYTRLTLRSTIDLSIPYTDKLVFKLSLSAAPRRLHCIGYIINVLHIRKKQVQTLTYVQSYQHKSFIIKTIFAVLLGVRQKNVISDVQEVFHIVLHSA